MCIYSLNWLGGMLGFVCVYLLGAIWYSPKVFGPAWMKALNKTKDDFKFSIISHDYFGNL